MNTITICGSMKFKEDILKYQNILEDMGFTVKIPVECIRGDEKKIASRAHFNRIIAADNDAILVINQDKGGFQNYIGPNTFAEIAFAFHFHKKIFLLNDLYDPLKMNWWDGMFVV